MARPVSLVEDIDYPEWAVFGRYRLGGKKEELATSDDQDDAAEMAEEFRAEMGPEWEVWVEQVSAVVERPLAEQRGVDKTWGDLVVGDRVWEDEITDKRGRRLKTGFIVSDIKHLPDNYVSVLLKRIGPGMPRFESVESHIDEPLVKDNPKKGMTYLAIMPRARKPKSVPKSHVAFYQKEAREFYEAPGMTAAEARQAIKDGTLKPTWIKGQPVVAYSAETGEPRTEARIFMADLMKQVEKSNDRDVVLRIGRKIYQPQYSYQPRHVYRPGGKPGGTSMTWHDTDISGFTYDPSPLTQGQLERHLRQKDTWEMVWLSEDYNGIPMGGIVALAQSGMGLEGMNSASIRARLSGLSGRRWGSRQRVDGGMLRPADLEWPY